MTETIKLMKAHTSVRRFKEQEIPQADLNEILTAAQMASNPTLSFLLEVRRRRKPYLS